MQLTDKQQQIVEQNHNLIYKILNERHLNTDYYDIAAIALCKAAITYENDVGKFSTYAYSVINNAINNEIKKNNRYNYNFPTDSIDSYYLDNENEQSIDIIAPDDTGNNANYSKLEQIIARYMSKRQKYIINCLSNGISYRDIANKLELSHNMIHLEVVKIRNIIKKYYNFENRRCENV